MFRKKPQAIYESMSRLGKIGLVPMYIVAEKRYCVAGKIIETFLDPYFNSAIAFPFTGDIFTKQELANTLYERLSDAYGAMRMSDGLIASGVTRDDAVAKLTALMHQGVLQSK